MNRLREKLDNIIFRAQFAVKNAANNLVEDEKGDTNFLSIAIVLIVVLAVAVAFIGFKDQLLPKFNTAISDLMSHL